MRKLRAKLLGYLQQDTVEGIKAFCFENLKEFHKRYQRDMDGITLGQFYKATSFGVVGESVVGAIERCCDKLGILSPSRGALPILVKKEACEALEEAMEKLFQNPVDVRNIAEVIRVYKENRAVINAN